MRTKTFLIGLMLLVGSIMKAQSSDATSTPTKSSPTSYIALNYGTSVPLGNYSTDGYALLGSAVSLSEGICIKRSNLGIAFKAEYISNGFDAQGYVNDNASSYNSTLAWQPVSSDNYAAANILVGLYSTLPFGRFAFDSRIMGGLILANYPGISFTGGNGLGYTETVTNDGCKSSAFSYDIGFDIRWNVSTHICLLLNYDYSSASPSFSTTQTIQKHYAKGTSPQPTTQSISPNQDYTILSATFGIGWVL